MQKLTLLFIRKDSKNNALVPTSGTWVAKIAVTGSRLFKGTTAYKSKIKRFCRPREEGKKAKLWRYLGVFPNELQAKMAYEAASAKEAIKLGIPTANMPPMRIVVRSCGTWLE